MLASSPDTSPAGDSMNIAIPLAVVDRNTEPSNDIATRMATAASSARPGPTNLVRPLTASLVNDHHHRPVQHCHVRDAYGDRPDKIFRGGAPHAPARAPDEWLQQATLSLAADGSECQKDGEHS